MRQANSVAAKGGLSAKSMIKAKSIAASILNMSENDLADIMETDQVSPGDCVRNYIQILSSRIISSLGLIKPRAFNIPVIDFF